MSFINKFGKTTVASSILAASVLGTTHVSFASGSGEGNQGQQGQNEDYMAIGNTRILKRYFHGRRWYGTCIQFSLSLLCRQSKY